MRPEHHGAHYHSVRPVALGRAVCGGRCWHGCPPAPVCVVCGLETAVTTHHWHYPDPPTLTADDLTPLCATCDAYATNRRRMIFEAGWTIAEANEALGAAIRAALKAGPPARTAKIEQPATEAAGLPDRPPKAAEAIPAPAVEVAGLPDRPAVAPAAMTKPALETFDLPDRRPTY